MQQHNIIQAATVNRQLHINYSKTLEREKICLIFIRKSLLGKNHLHNRLIQSVSHLLFGGCIFGTNLYSSLRAQQRRLLWRALKSPTLPLPIHTHTVPCPQVQGWQGMARLHQEDRPESTDSLPTPLTHSPSLHESNTYSIQYYV